MATVTDVLETVLRLSGLPQYLQGFDLIGTAVDKLANSAFVQFDRQVLRTQFFLQEFGHSLPTAEIANFARQLSLATGETQTSIASLMGYLARFRDSGTDLERFTRDTVNAAQAFNKSLDQMGHIVEMMRSGHAKAAWRELGIQLKGVEGQFYSTDQIMTMLERHTAGFSALWATTLPHSLQQTGAALQDVAIQFGRLLQAARPVVDFVNRSLEGWAMAFKGIADLLHIPAAEGLGGAATAAAGGGGSAQQRMLAYLEQITRNTGPQGALAKALTRGGSAEEPGAHTGIRDFNAAFRRAR